MIFEIYLGLYAKMGFRQQKTGNVICFRFGSPAENRTQI